MKLVHKAAKTLTHLVNREIAYHRIKPTHLLLFLTYRCTSRCKTCTMWQRKSDQPEMTLEEWQRFIAMAAPCGIRNVELFGGDALLRKDVLIPLVRYIRAQGIPEVDLVTNGNLMDQATASGLADAGLHTLFVSLDGVDETQDAVRGREGSFAKVKDTIAYMKAARNADGVPQIVLNCTVSALNVNGFDRVFAFAKEQAVDAVAFEYAGEFPEGALRRSAVCGIVPQPYFISQGSSILVNREQAIDLKQKIRKIKEQKRPDDVAVITKNIDVLKLDNLTKGEFPNKKCYICRYLVTVDPFGNVLPCAFFNNYHLGNVRTEKFAQIWRNKKHRDFIRTVDQEKVELCRYCVVGVERNPTVMQELRKAYFQFTGAGYDEQTKA